MVLRPRVGLRPTSPQQAAGARMEPKPSEAWAAGSIRAPTAAAAPPLEPPEMRPRSHGFFVGPVEQRLAGEAQAQLARVGAPEDHHAGAFQALDVLAVLGRHDILEEPAAPCGRAAGEGGAEVLQQVRHALERSTGQSGGDRPAAVVVELVRDRVDRPVARIDPLDGRFQERLRGGLAACHQLREADRVVVLVFFEACHFMFLLVRKPG